MKKKTDLRIKKYLNDVASNKRVTGRRAVTVSRFLRSTSDQHDFRFWVTSKIYANPSRKYIFGFHCYSTQECEYSRDCVYCYMPKFFGFSRVHWEIDCLNWQSFLLLC